MSLFHSRCNRMEEMLVQRIKDLEQELQDERAASATERDAAAARYNSLADRLLDRTDPAAAQVRLDREATAAAAVQAARLAARPSTPAPRIAGHIPRPRTAGGRTVPLTDNPVAVPSPRRFAIASHRPSSAVPLQTVPGNIELEPEPVAVDELVDQG